uniref:Uncharacterized protein n=1 Tax=Candidatus Kentrum sp. FM TaxID=2126340 RepID=A0A450T201_9GAMM
MVGNCKKIVKERTEQASNEIKHIPEDILDKVINNFLNKAEEKMSEQKRANISLEEIKDLPIGARDFYRLISISYVSVINKIFTIT